MRRRGVARARTPSGTSPASVSRRRPVHPSTWEWRCERHAGTTGGFMPKHGKRYRAAPELASKAGTVKDLAEAVKLVKQTARAKFDETDRRLVAPRRRSAPRGPAGPRHGRAAARHRQDGARAGARARARRRRKPRRPAPISSAPTTTSRRSRTAGSTSTPSSPRPT